MRFLRSAAAMLIAAGALWACTPARSPGGSDAVDAGLEPSIDAGGGADAGIDAGPDGGQIGSNDGGCLGSELLASFGSTKLLVGGSFEDETATKAPFDVRYLYIAGGFNDGLEPCESCASPSCRTGAALCGSAHGGCAWWGCWQWDQDPPGQYAVDFRERTTSDEQIPWFTYYQVLQASGVAEGAPEVHEANDLTFMRRYFNDFRLLLQRIGAQAAFVHLEPDFWGYAQQLEGDPDRLPAKVSSANAADCANQPETISGFGRCLVAMVRRYSPNAKVGFHASPWATGIDVTFSDDAALDVAGEAAKLGAFLKKLGAADFVAVDSSDRDAGFYQRSGRDSWWDATNESLPNFHRAFAWTKALAESVGQPVVFWQTPLGNAAQNDTNGHWKDNRVDYFFAHTDELVRAHVAAILFGAGEDRQTTPESDGGNFVNKAMAYYSSGGRNYCP